MIKKYWPYILGAGIAAWYFTRLKKTADAIKVNLSDIKIKKGKGFSLPILELNFEIQNPTTNEVNVLGVTGDMYINDEYLSNISNLKTVKIPANNSIIYSVDIKTSALDAFTNFLSLVKKNTTGVKKGINVKATLDVNVDGILYPTTIERKVV